MAARESRRLASHMCQTQKADGNPPFEMPPSQLPFSAKCREMHVDVKTFFVVH
jgi:hypothetical protein